MQTFYDRLTQFRSQLDDCERQYGRPANSVQLLAVSKTQPPTELRNAFAAGQRAFGENYLQEALEKCMALSDLPLEWHFIGHIQSNKTSVIAQHFHWVHSVDRLKIAERLSAQRPAQLAPLNICLQVDLDAEPQKGGVAPTELRALACAVNALPNLRLRGLMALPTPREDFAAQRQSLARLQNLFRALAEELNTKTQNHFDTLSMGMSDDWPAAVAEGATMIRIGTALFGARRA
ncbi:MAG: YggS family pyridoxal phosphate-dependent enzyme [Gammaproteobacteria bacterium]|nr:YggS family pyridoxal phosphate-dependent enzyme [Gammaproteobacteria bacterium]